MKRIGLMVLVACLAAGGAGAVDSTEKIESYRTQFVPTKPTVAITYSLEYRFSDIRLMRVAMGMVRTTEGTWRPLGGASNIPAFFMEANFDTYDKADDGRRKSFWSHDHMISVLTNPQADNILYVRKTDRYFNPLLGSRKLIKQLKVYDLQSGSMDYFYEDYLNHVTNTVLTGSTNLLQQGSEVSQLFKMIASMYQKIAPLVDFTNSPTIYVDTDDAVVPFVAQTRFAESPVAIKGGNTGSLRVEIRTVPGGKGRNGHMTIWVTPFRELAGKLKDETLVQLAEQSPAWAVVPLKFEYDLMIGCMCGVLTDIQVVNAQTNGVPPAAIFKPSLPPYVRMVPTGL